MTSGGPRVGAPGAAYSNRSDLQSGPRQPIQTATGQPYGAAQAQRQAQQAIPLPATNQGVVPLDHPTQRPDEHVMTGAPQGPGPGPEVLNMPFAPPLQASVGDQVRAIYSAFPNPDLAALVASLVD